MYRIYMDLTHKYELKSKSKKHQRIKQIQIKTGVVPSRIRALTKSRSKSTSGLKVNIRRRLGEETPSVSVATRKRRQGRASPR